MKSLRALQLAFSGAVLGEEYRVPRAIASPPAGDRRGRFGIYREGYRLRLIESLATDYPATRAVLGAERFTALTRAFVETHPSPYFNLRWYGPELAEFARARCDDECAPIADLAAFEWAIAGAFDAADADPVTTVDMARVPLTSWPRLVFALHPSVRRVEVPPQVPELWKAATAGAPLPPAPTAGAADASWIVWRRDLGVLYRRMDPIEAEGLDRAAAGATFADLCAGLSAHVPEAETPGRAAVLLRRWIEEGLVTGLRDGATDLLSDGESWRGTAAPAPSAPG
jgi:hypothetical protein